MLTLLAVVLLADVASPRVPTVAVPVLRGAGVAEDKLNVYSDHLAIELRNAGLKVTTSTDIATMLGTERQRQLLGCSDESGSCMAELAAALGTDFTVTGDVSIVADGFRVSVGLLRANDVVAAARYAEQVSNEAGVLRALSRGGWRLGSVALARASQVPVGVPPEAVTLGDPPPARRLAWLPAAVGVASGIAGALLISRAYDDLRQLDPITTLSLADAQRYRDEGKLLYPIGVTCVVVAAAALVTSGVMYFAGGGQPQNVQLSLLMTGDQATVALRGRFP